MFSAANMFNCDISKWDVSSVTKMDNMFFHAESFKQTLCGEKWIQSKASKKDMFTGSSGSISSTRCVNGQPVTLPDRELIAKRPSRTSPVEATIATEAACPKCGVFKKSGRPSCCAPGGTWFQNCGGVSNKNVEHTWTEGVSACEAA